MEFYVLFTGHMIDAPGRKHPRFPPGKEDSAREQISKQLTLLKSQMKNWRGIAAAACGADILFHECCRELNIPSAIYLALPAAEFKKKSVSFAGKNWEDRFDKLTQQLPVYILQGTDTSKHLWTQANEWLLETALKNGAWNMVLIALWDLKPGDGSGGTGDMVNRAREQKAAVRIIDMNLI